MSPSRFKGERKSSTENKAKHDGQGVTVLFSQRKKRHTEESTSRGKRQHGRESIERVPSEDPNSDENDLPVVSKSKRKARRPKERKEGDLEGGTEERESRIKESHSHRRHGEQFVYREEKSKIKGMRQEDQNSKQHHNMDVKRCKLKGTDDCEKHALQQKYKGRPSKCKHVSDRDSVQVESEKGSFGELESCQGKSQDESRGLNKRKPCCESKGKATKREKEGCNKTPVKRPGRESLKASPVDSEDSSWSDSQDRCHWKQRRENKKRGKKKMKASKERRNSSENSEEELSGKMGSQEERGSFQELQETTSGSEEKLDTVAEKQESEDEESISDEERNERSKSVLPSDMEDGDENCSENQMRGPTEEGGKEEEESYDGENENPSGKGSSKEDCSGEQSRSGSEREENEINRCRKRSSDPSTLSSTLLKAGRSKSLQGNYQVKEAKSSGERASVETTSSPQLVRHRRQSSDLADLSQRSTGCEAQKSQNARPSLDAMVLLAKRCNHLTTRSQILLNLKSKHEDAKGRLLDREEFCHSPQTAEIVPLLEETQSVRTKRDGTTNMKVVTKTKECKQSRLATVSSSPSKPKKLTAEKKKKVGKGVGKLKRASHGAAETTEEVEVVEENQTGEDADQKDLTSKQARTKSFHTLSAFRKVTHWLTPKTLKKVSLKDRLLSIVRAIGISGWLLRRFDKKRRSEKSFGLRKSMAVRIVSTVGLAKRCRKASYDPAGEQMETDVYRQGSSCIFLENDQTGERDIGWGKELEERTQSSNILSCNEVTLQSLSVNPNGRSAEVKNTFTDTKYAIVFPRVHQLVKSKTSSLGSSVESQSGVQSCVPSRKKPVQYAVLKTNEKRNSQVLPCRPQVETFTPAEGKVPWVPPPSWLEEEDVADLSQTSTPQSMNGVHWTQHPPPPCDPAVWLNSETLLPRLTVENLSKWALYKDQDVAKSPRSKRAFQGRWEADDASDDALEKDLGHRQGYRDEDCYMELDKVEDLSRLEEVCESSVLLCLKKRFHLNFIYTYTGHILISVNPFKHLSLYSEDVMIQYQKGMFSRNAPHVFALTEMAYTFSQSSEKDQCIVIRDRNVSLCIQTVAMTQLPDPRNVCGHSGSGKTETAKAIILYLSRMYRRQESHGKKQPYDVLPILESFGNAKTVLNDNSSRFGKFLRVHLRQGFVVGTSVCHYLLEKCRVVFQNPGERSFHVFYEFLAGLPTEQKEKLYLQESETYFYLNQGGVCEFPGKQDHQDFLVLTKALQMIGLSDDQLTSAWRVLAGILQLGNICFTSCEKGSSEFAIIPSETEIQIIANLLHISADLLQKVITQRVTETCYDRIVTPLSVESAIDTRDAIAKILYSVLFDWLLVKVNEWMEPLEVDRTLGIVDIYGFENLGVNSLEQLCINFADEHLQHFFHRRVIAQEEEEYIQEGLVWSPVLKMAVDPSCLDLIVAKPYGILHILDDQTSLTQATDHTFLQKCHYHHSNSPCYVKPKLPLPAFTVQHGAGSVTYQVHKFLNKNHDQLHPEVLDIFSHSHLELVSSLFQRFKEQQTDQRGPGAQGRGPGHPSSTLVSRFQQSLQDLTGKLNRSHIFFVRCIKPNSKKVPDIFDTEYVASQLRHSGILEAVCLRKEGYPIRIPFRHFLIRYGTLAGRGQSSLPEREGCAGVLSNAVGDQADLYQIGASKVFLKEKARQMLERRWNQKLSWAIVTLQRNLRSLLKRRWFQLFQKKVTIIQAYFRGYLARKRYQRLKMTLGHFRVAVLISRPLVHQRKHYYQRREDSWLRNESLIKAAEEHRRYLEMDVRRLEIPAELAALLSLVEGHQHALAHQVTEVSPPEVNAKADLSLPSDINSFPFSIFVRAHFQEMSLPALGQPLPQPLTRLDAEQKQIALQLNKLILRFIHDKDLESWQEEVLGNYLVSRGLASLSLRNELLCQVATQVWRNPDPEQCQRGWVLMAALLGSFPPSPALEKPLLKFVSDYGLEGYNALCQHKLLMSMRQKESDPEVSRCFPPTQLEWTTNRRKGKMVLEVYTYKEERLSAEVESWTTGEQYAGWILRSRGLEAAPRGWSVSMSTDEAWHDLPGCDFVLDLIGQIEESSWPSDSTPEYPITPERDESFFHHKASDRMFLSIPPAPNIRAPSAPPPSLPPDYDGSALPGSTNSSRSKGGLDYYVDDLFRPLSRVYLSDTESEGSLTERMKGGGKIGPTQPAAFPGYSGMMNVPAYQSLPVMGGMMPTTMPVMPGLGGMGTMPGMVMPQPQPLVPPVDPNQMAAQQQAFINQQALLLAQQMTLQAMTISQQQQQQGQPRPPRERSPEPSRPRRPSSWKRSPEFSRPRRASPPSSPEFSRPRRASPKRRSPDSPRPREASFQQRSPERSRARQASTRRRSPESSRPRRASSQERLPESSEQRQHPLLPPPVSKPKGSTFKNKDVSASPHKPPKPTCILQEEFAPDVQADSLSKGSFQKKVEYFQKIGQHVESPVMKGIPPSKKWSQPKTLPSEEPERPQGAGLKPSSGLTPPTQKKPEPSQEIQSIVAAGPDPPPPPAKPVRNISQPFLKKSDPKEEALAKLGIVGWSPPPPSSGFPERNSPPPLAPPVKLSNSIKEKQLPLMNLFSRPPPTSPPAAEVSPPPPPAPGILPPPSSFPSDRATMEKKDLKGSWRTMVEEASVETQLLNLSATVSFSYANPSWKLFLRKEVFYPKENFSHPYCLNLLCDQIIRDTYSESCVRVSREERRKMKDLLMEFKVNSDASSIPEDGIKKRIVVAARDNWANYFSRLFPVKGENGSDVQILAVSHRGLQLLKRAKEASFSPEHLKILCSYSYADVLSLELMGRDTLQFSLKNEQLILHSPKASQIRAMVELFLRELKQDSNYVMALRSYVTDDKSLLTFKKGEYIQLMRMEGLEPGWMFGSIGGRSGLFPSGLVQVVAAPDYLNLRVTRQEEVRKSLRKSGKESQENSVPSMPLKITTNNTTNTHDTCRYTMAEFASAHFRDAQSMLGLKGMNNDERKDPAVLVQHTKVPIQKSLLVYSDGEMNDLATKAFLTLMRFMGDKPGIKHHHEVDYIYKILQLCKEKENLCDEIYCQVIKQITQNPQQHSCSRGWQLLSLLTGYFLPSSTLMPYATKYLQQASADDTNLCKEIAWTCQRNLRKNTQNGGRRHLPSRVEMEAFLKGHTSRQVSVNLPGGQGYATRIKTFTVAEDLLKEIAELMGITEPVEIEEFALLVSREDGKMARPLHQREYIHDYLAEDKSVVLNFCRMTWKTPLHFENENYINIHYNQVLQNYMTGKLLLHYSSRLEELVGTLAVFQHWAKGTASTPSIRELTSYIPAPVAHLINPEALQASVSDQLQQRKGLEQQEAKIHFLERMVQLPLFGYHVYPVERMSMPGLPTPCFVGVNEEQIIVVDGNSQLHCQIPLREIRYMRTLRPLDEDGSPGLEVSYGSAEDPQTAWFELRQAKALYRTIALIAKEAAESMA